MKDNNHEKKIVQIFYFDNNLFLGIIWGTYSS